MAARKINWRRLRSRIYLLAMVAGFCFYIYDYKFWFVLEGYKVEAQSSVIEQRLWEIFPRRCLTFWPYLLKDSNGLKEFLERDMPVTVETRMTELGRFTTKIEWLKAWIKVEWRGKIWCISRDGRMWLFENGSKSDDTGRLIWKIPSQDTEGESANMLPISGVFKAPIQTEVIASFLYDFEGFKWFEAASEISWERRAGMNLFILKLTNGTQKFDLYFQPDKYPGQDIGQNIEEVFEDAIKEGNRHVLIDATYDGKISLRNL
ncbi:MAG: hypothetical protein IJS40_05890 [Synergistaceae bacterium]|nr:hypothetical protein [Synergistaceae bacterium]